VQGTSKRVLNQHTDICLKAVRLEWIDFEMLPHCSDILARGARNMPAYVRALPSTGDEAMSRTLSNCFVLMFQIAFPRRCPVDISSQALTTAAESSTSEG